MQTVETRVSNGALSQYIALASLILPRRAIEFHAARTHILGPVPLKKERRLAMKLDTFRTLSDQYEIATQNLIQIARRALAGDMTGLVDSDVLVRATDAHAAFVEEAAKVSADLDQRRTRSGSASGG